MEKPDSLIKFCSTSTAELILSSQSLRWSSPHIFADPFELDHNTGLNFDKKALLQSAIKLCAAMIFAHDHPKGDTPLINAIRRWRDDERFRTPDEAEKVLKDLLVQMVEQHHTTVEKYLASWINYNKTIRICCFSGKPDNVIAWQRFADNHKGIAIKFECNEFASTKNPTAVEYIKDRPELSTLKSQISSLLYNIQGDSGKNFKNILAAKPLINKYEHEWRCFRQTPNPEVPDDPNQWFDDIKFERSEVSAIYLGLSINPADKEQLIKIAKENYSAAKIYQTQLVNQKYEIEMIKI